MLSKAKVAACSDIRTKHSTQSEGHVRFLNVNWKVWWKTFWILKPRRKEWMLRSRNLIELCPVKDSHSSTYDRPTYGQLK